MHWSSQWSSQVSPSKRDTQLPVAMCAFQLADVQVEGLCFFVVINNIRASVTCTPLKGAGRTAAAVRTHVNASLFTHMMFPHSTVAAFEVPSQDDTNGIVQQLTEAQVAVVRVELLDTAHVVISRSPDVPVFVHLPKSLFQFIEATNQSVL